MKLGGYGFIRFFSFSSFSLHFYRGYLVSLGLVGGLIRCFLCLRQVDLKAFVAYSSVCHMGFGLAGFYSLSQSGLNGGFIILLAHGFCSSCLFYILYVFYERFHTRRLFIVKGLGYLITGALFFWFIFSILNMGVPPSFSFFSEIAIITGILNLNFFAFLFVGVFLFLAGVYGIFLYVVSCHGVSLLEGQIYTLFRRELLNMYGHFFPLVFVPFVLRFFLF